MNATTKKLNLKSLKSEIISSKKSLLNLKFQKSTGQLEKTSEIRKARRKISLLKTSINQQKEKQDA